ncbi:MAG TPA: cobalamin-binding protein [Methylibium sp.]|nr:cobalamin-binding protein [Methylibium sp.]
MMQRIAPGLALLAVALSLRAAPIDFVDDAGRAHRLPGPAQRVVTLAPHLTEIVYAVGAGGQLVGTIDASDHPLPARALPRIGDHARFDVERLLLLKPDLVLAWLSGNPDREVRALEAAGLRVVRFESQRLGEVAASIERVARLLGRDAEGAQAARRLRAELEAQRQRHAGAAPLRVFYQVWPQPLLTLNGRHLVSDVLALCGGRNVFADLAPLVPPVSTEAVLAADPEVVLTGSERPEQPWSHQPDAAVFAPWRAARGLAATRRGAYYRLDGDLIARAGPRIGLGVQAVCEVLERERRRAPSVSPQRP